MATKQLKREDYTVGWICAIHIERAVAEAMLDEIQVCLPKIPDDDNSYTYGSIYGHNVVIACLPSGQYGTSSATAVAKDMLRSFRIRVGLMVGIGGGVPKNDVRLGDVVVSNPDGRLGGVVQYDFGKAMADGYFLHTGSLSSPSTALLHALSSLRSHYEKYGDEFLIHISKMTATYPRMKEQYATTEKLNDVLFTADDKHLIGSENCEGCLACFKPISREPRLPRVHYGLIASGNQVIKDGEKRDTINRQMGDNVLCFEMEAAGLMRDFPCLIIRGICDYADSHKNKSWQKVAAAMAAAYAKEFLKFILPEELTNTPVISIDFRVPFNLRDLPKVNDFVGRAADIEILEATLLPKIKVPQKKMVFISGLGGIGKTQLSLAYVQRNYTAYDSVFFLNGRSKATLLKDFAEIAARLSASQVPTEHRNYGSSIPVNEEVVDYVKLWLNLQGNTNWLLIFDNVDGDPYEIPRDNDTYDLKDYLPKADHGSIIVTTRICDMGYGHTCHHLKILNRVDSIQLLKVASHRKIPESQFLDTLLFKLDGLPLALVQAGAYMFQTGCSISEYLNSYIYCWNELKEAEHKHSGNMYVYSESIITTWSISYQRIHKISESSSTLLQLWSFLDNADLWYDFIAPISTLSIDDTFQDFRSQMKTVLGFHRAIEVLLNYNLVQAHDSPANGCATYGTHPIVHEWIYRSITLQLPEQKRTALKILALTAIRDSISHRDQSWALQKRLLLHADRWRHLNNKNQLVYTSNFPQNLIIVSGLCSLGELYSDQYKLSEAAYMYHGALDGYKKTFGRFCISERLLDIVLSIGCLLFRKDHLDEAEKWLLKALSGYETLFGPSHPLTLSSLAYLGLLYVHKGKPQKAENCLLRVMREQGSGDRSVLDAQHSLGILYFGQGKFAEAEKMYLQALSGYEEAYGPEYPLVINVLQYLGHLAFAQKRFQDAEQLYIRAVKGYEKVWGLDHKATLDTMESLGNLYREQRRWLEAEEISLKVSKAKEKAHDYDNIPEDSIKRSRKFHM